MRKNFLKISVLVVAVIITLLAFGSWKSSTSKNTPCEESMEQCCKKKSRGSESNIWETGTSQFLSSTELN